MGAPTDRLVLAADGPLADALSQAFELILAQAQVQLERVATDPASAIHEHRKAVRRARGLLAGCRGLVRRRDRCALARELRAVHRSLSAQRDLDVLPAALDLTRPGPELAPLVARFLRGSDRERTSPDGLAEALDEANQRLQPLPAMFRQALPRDARWKRLLGGVTRTYRRGRNALEAWRADGDDEALHDWRKRAKELAHLLELTSGRSAAAGEMRAAYARLAKSLGEVTDLLQLRRRLDVAASAEPALRPLAERVANRYRTRAKAVEARGGSLFADRPKAFTALLTQRAD